MSIFAGNLLNPACNDCYDCGFPECTDCSDAESNFGIDIDSLEFTGAEQPADPSLGGEDYFNALARCGGSTPVGSYFHSFGGWGSAGTISDLSCFKQIGVVEGPPVTHNPIVGAYVQLDAGCATGSGIAYEGDSGGWNSGYGVGYQVYCESGVPRLRMFGNIGYGLAYVTADNQPPNASYFQTFSIGDVRWTIEATSRRSSNPFTYFYSRSFVINNVTESRSIDFSSVSGGSDPQGWFNGVASLTLP